MDKRKIYFKIFVAIIPLLLLLVWFSSKINFSEDKEVFSTLTQGMPCEWKLDSNGKLLNPGDEVTVNFTIKNITDSNKENIELKLICDGECKAIGKDTLTIECLEANKEAKAEWKVKCKSGGTRFIVQIKDSKKNIDYVKVGGVTVSGKGWFLGDNNTHTNYSDGSGSVAENIWAMRSEGLNYITMTDHNNSSGYEESKSSKGNGEIIIKGNEYTNPLGSALLINSKDNKNYSSLTKENLIKEVNNYNTLVYVAHPFDDKAPWKFDNYEGVNGIEVWNGKYDAKSKENNDAFILWDKLNKEGKHLYGVADSNAHSPKDVGKVYVKTYVDAFTEESIIDAQKKGHMYGTNGPSIQIKVNNAMMGDDYKVASSGDIIKVNLKGEYYNGISKLRLIRNGEVIIEKNINNTKFDISERLRVVPGDFIRMEVEGNKNEVLPFAFSNPIFMVKK